MYTWGGVTVMISAVFSLATLSYSSHPGLTLNIFLDEQRAIVTSVFSGDKPDGLKIIFCGFGTFWPEVVSDLGQPVPMTAWGQSAKEKLFKYRGGMRDYSWNILARKTQGPWRLGDFRLQEIYRLEPGKTYWVRGVYDNASGTSIEKATFISKTKSFTLPGK